MPGALFNYAVYGGGFFEELLNLSYNNFIRQESKHNI